MPKRKGTWHGELGVPTLRGLAGDDLMGWHVYLLSPLLSRCTASLEKLKMMNVLWMDCG